MEISPTSAGVAVVAADRRTELSWRWLLDHGEDETSFDPITRQRRVDALGEAPAPACGVEVRVIDGVEVVALTWADRDPTWVSTATIERAVSGAPAADEICWDHPDQVQLTVGDVKTVSNDDDALAEWLSDLVRYGFARLTGFDAAAEDLAGAHRLADALAGRIGYVRRTVFGTTWELASDVDLHDDTAYTQTFLGPHTDGTYSHDAPGLQMFCCVDRTGTGGESIIVDGFAAAEQLQREHGEHYETLTSVAVPAHYIESGVELRASRPALRLGSNGELHQVSLNNYDRSPMALDPEAMERFYAAYASLQRLVEDESRQCSIRLEPGDVLINDNWRVLHGRHAYTGARRFVGCYLNHEDFESRCRTLGLNTRWD